MAQPAVELVSGKERGTDNPLDEIEKRRTAELVIAVCGPLGSGTTQVAEEFSRIFSGYDYVIKPIKVSELIVKAYQKAIKKGEISPVVDLNLFTSNSDRIDKLQTAGNFLRETFGRDFLAQLVIREIAVDRKLVRESRKIVWIVDSLKHPDEVRLLRTVYDKMFNLVGVLCPRNERKSRLHRIKDLTQVEAEIAIERDESEDISHGQKLIKTLQHADFFVRNYLSNTYETVKRYSDLLVGQNNITPTIEEYAMFVAYASSYRSGCLSRQVGSSIVSETGEILSTGFNDPPKASGGLYSAEDARRSYDFRCMSYGGKNCNNESYKKNITDIIKNTLITESIDGNVAAKITDLIAEDGRINDLTEFCRAVHAEMDAITTAARNGIRIKDSTLFVTTFPCHNCAKHLISSGIKRVYYIEPYEKSLALKLHYDAIAFESGEGDEKKVQFLHFEGVSPRQYSNRFPMVAQRKKDGRLEEKDLRKSKPMYAQFIDSFIDYESKVMARLDEIDFAIFEDGEEAQ